MDPLRIYDYLTQARHRIFDAVRSLPADQYNHEFPIGLKTLGCTLTHMMIVEWSYAQRMQGNDLPPYETWPIQDENPPPFDVIEKTWRDQAPTTRQTIEQLSSAAGWSREFTYVSRSRPAGDGELRLTEVTVSPADIFTQLVLHEVHHRAQVMHMLRQIGAVVEDIDFSYLMFKRRVLE